MVQHLGEMDPRDPRWDMAAAAANDLSVAQMAERDRVFVEVLRDCTVALGETGLRYGLIGGIASSGYGRPRWTHDIDVFCRPDDAGRVLEVLARHGFDTERTDPHWLFKGFKKDVLVDVIFQSHGAIYLDAEMIEHIVMREHLGVLVPLIAPEDLLVMKAVVHDEQGPRHWHDALGLIAGGCLDWAYLLRRGQRAPRRVLSLLVYAHSLDLDVPNHVIKDLYHRVYES